MTNQNFHRLFAAPPLFDVADKAAMAAICSAVPG
jgi:hypothetical protein